MPTDTAYHDLTCNYPAQQVTWKKKKDQANQAKH